MIGVSHFACITKPLDHVVATAAIFLRLSNPSYICLTLFKLLLTLVAMEYTYLLNFPSGINN